MVTNWKTFLSSVFLAVMLNGAAFGIPPKIATPLAAASAIALGASAKDKDVTGVGANAQRKK